MHEPRGERNLEEMSYSVTIFPTMLRTLEFRSRCKEEGPSRPSIGEDDEGSDSDDGRDQELRRKPGSFKLLCSQFWLDSDKHNVGGSTYALEETPAVVYGRHRHRPRKDGIRTRTT